jgi:hypothetical protein
MVRVFVHFVYFVVNLCVFHHGAFALILAGDRVSRLTNDRRS